MDIVILPEPMHVGWQVVLLYVIITIQKYTSRRNTHHLVLPRITSGRGSHDYV